MDRDCFSKMYCGQCYERSSDVVTAEHRDTAFQKFHTVRYTDEGRGDIFAVVSLESSMIVIMPVLRWITEHLQEKSLQCNAKKRKF